MGLGGFSYFSALSSEKDFAKFKTYADENNMIGETKAALLNFMDATSNFVLTGESVHKERMEKASSNIGKGIKSLEEIMVNKDNLRLMKDAQESHEKQDKEITELEGTFEHREELLNGKEGLVKNGEEINKLLTEVMEASSEEEDNHATIIAGETLTAFNLARIKITEYVHDYNADDLKEAKNRLKIYDGQLQKLEETLSSGSEKKIVQKVDELSKEYSTTLNNFETMITKLQTLRSEIVAQGDLILKDFEDLKNRISVEQTKLGEEVLDNMKKTESASIFISIFSILLGIVLGFSIGRSIINALMRITRELADTSIQNAAAAQQLASASQQLSAGATEQASSIEETSSSLEELSGMVENNVANAEKAYELSKQMQASSQEGNESMHRLQESMGLILESNEKIKELVRVITNIADKTEVMDEIVFQTKLLSFNASVEAERAGEHGRGFAVVAQEVGNLAHMSGKAAQEIAQIVKESIVNAEAITAENRKKVEIGSEIVKESAKILADITEAASTVSQGSHQVLEASQDQSKGIQQISIAMNQVDTATQQNAATAEETASTSEELSAQTKNLDRLVDQLNEMVTGSRINNDIGQQPSRQVNRPSSKSSKVVNFPKAKSFAKNSHSTPPSSHQESLPKVSGGDGWDQL